MRIIAGQFGGRRLPAAVPKGTRPTSDRVREALFSVLHSRGATENAHVLDLFAGTGALGLEALSRGATDLLAVEQDRNAFRAITQNQKALGLQTRCRLLQTDILKLTAETLLAASPSGETFDLVLVDPPYRAQGPVFDFVDRVLTRTVLSPGALVAFEHASSDSPPTPQNLEEVRRYRYGDTGVVLLAAIT